jgi:hypothetical protein
MARQVPIGFFTGFALHFVYRGGAAFADVLDRVAEGRPGP